MSFAERITPRAEGAPQGWPAALNEDAEGRPYERPSEASRYAAAVYARPAREEGPAVLRLRMLELGHELRRGALDVEAREAASVAFEGLREAVLTRPALTFADASARLRTLGGLA